MKKRYQRALALLCVAALLAALLCACKKEQQPDQPEQSDQPQTSQQPDEPEQPAQDESPQAPVFDLSEYSLKPAADYDQIGALMDRVINSDTYAIASNEGIVSEFFNRSDTPTYAGNYGELLAGATPLPGSVKRADSAVLDNGYVYSLSGSELRILSAQAAQSETVGTATVCQTDISYENYDETPQAVTVWGDTAAVITYVYAWSTSEGDDGEWDAESISRTHVKLFDVSDKAAPVQTFDYVLDGAYLSAYLVEGKLYLCADYYVGTLMEDPESYIPVCGEAGQEAMLDAGGIYVNDQTDNAQYCLLSAIDLDAGSCIGTVAAIGAYQLAFADDSTAYLYGSCYAKKQSDPYTKNQYQVVDYYCQAITLVGRLSLDGGLSLDGSACVNGRMDDPYVIDCVDGQLRLGTLAESYCNRLYTDEALGFENLETGEHVFSYELHVLSPELAPMGELAGLNEQTLLYYERFVGDTAYLIAYDTKQPVYTVDLSDPTNPKIGQSLSGDDPAELLLRTQNTTLGLSAAGQVRLLQFSAGQMTELAQLDVPDSYYSTRYHLDSVLLTDELAVLGAAEGFAVLQLGQDSLTQLCTVDLLQDGSTRVLYDGQAIYFVQDAGVTVVDPASGQELAHMDLAVG